MGVRFPPGLPETEKTPAVKMDIRNFEMQNYLRWFLGIFLIGLATFSNSYFSYEPVLYRVIGAVVLVSLSLLVLVTTKEGRNVWQIILESRTEIRRVVWPTRNETIQTTMIVLVAITVAGSLLWGLDSFFSWLTASFLR